MKVKQYYLLKCFDNLKRTYQCVKYIRTKQAHRQMRQVFYTLRHRQLTKCAKRYKERQAHDQLSFKKIVKIFYVFKIYTKKYAHCKKMHRRLT